MLTPFFTKAESAAFLGGILSFFSSFLFLFVVIKQSLESNRYYISIFSPSAFALAFYEVSYFLNFFTALSFYRKFQDLLSFNFLAHKILESVLFLPCFVSRE